MLARSSYRFPRARSGRVVWATLVFIAGFSILLAITARWYLIPAMHAAQEATGDEKRQLAASSRLLLAVVLFILVAGILLTFRFGRYFLPRSQERAKPTQYPDAWAESARRVHVPPADEDDDEAEEDDRPQKS